VCYSLCSFPPIGDFKGVRRATASMVKLKLVVENLDEMLIYALALLNQVFLAHRHVIVDLF